MRRGFTLVELLIVVAALALLMGLFLGAFRSVTEETRYQVTQGRVRALGEKVAEVRGLTGRCPGDLIDLAPAIDQPGWIENGRFMDAYGRPIRYDVSGRTFRVWSVGSDGAPGTPDDIGYGR